MPDLDDRLQRCVLSVFPALSAETLPKISLAQLAAADSLAAVSLVAVLGQEFGLDLDIEDLLTMDSFDALSTRVARHAGETRQEPQ